MNTPGMTLNNADLVRMYGPVLTFYKQQQDLFKALFDLREHVAKQTARRRTDNRMVQARDHDKDMEFLARILDIGEYSEYYRYFTDVDISRLKSIGFEKVWREDETKAVIHGLMAYIEMAISSKAVAVSFTQEQCLIMILLTSRGLVHLLMRARQRAHEHCEEIHVGMPDYHYIQNVVEFYGYPNPNYPHSFSPITKLVEDSSRNWRKFCDGIEAGGSYNNFFT